MSVETFTWVIRSSLKKKVFERIRATVCECFLCAVLSCCCGPLMILSFHLLYLYPSHWTVKKEAVETFNSFPLQNCLNCPFCFVLYSILYLSLSEWEFTLACPLCLPSSTFLPHYFLATLLLFLLLTDCLIVRTFNGLFPLCDFFFFLLLVLMSFN